MARKCSRGPWPCCFGSVVRQHTVGSLHQRTRLTPRKLERESGHTDRDIEKIGSYYLPSSRVYTQRLFTSSHQAPLLKAFTTFCEYHTGTTPLTHGLWWTFIKPLHNQTIVPDNLYPLSFYLTILGTSCKQNQSGYFS